MGCRRVSQRRGCSATAANVLALGLVVFLLVAALVPERAVAAEKPAGSASDSNKEQGRSKGSSAGSGGSSSSGDAGTKEASKESLFVQETVKTMASAVDKGEFKQAWALVYNTIGEVQARKVDIPFDDKLYLLEEGSRLARHLRLFHESAEIQMQILQEKAKKGLSSFKYLTTFLELSSDYLRSGDFKEAMEWVKLAKDRLSSGLTEDSYHLIDIAEAKIHSCVGNAAAAFEMTRQAETSVSHLTRDEQRAYYTDLGIFANRYRQERVMAAAARVFCESSDPKECEEEQRSAYSNDVSVEDLKQYEQEVGILLTDKFGYKKKLQLPRHFDPELRAVPFHDRDAMWPHVRAAAAAVEGAHEELVSEYASITESELLVEDTDCLHKPPGKWERYEVMGPWTKSEFHGCSLDTPAACRLLERLNAIENITVARMGFSSISPSTWIRPFYGASNRRITLHLGLSIPHQPVDTILGPALPPDVLSGNTTAHRRAGGDKGSPFKDKEYLCGQDQCAFLRAGDETRCWRQGKVLVFDDSFQHEAFNACEKTRVVFQVVLLHPELPPDSANRTANLVTLGAL